MKIKSIICALLACLMLAACGTTKENSAQSPQSGKSFYLDMAQMYIDQGDIPAAIRILQEGMDQSDDPELRTLWEQLMTDTPTQTDPVTDPIETFPVPTVPTEVTEPVQIQLLTEENQQRINIFLSNFAEQNMTAYPADSYSKLNFGYIFCKINFSSKLQSDSSGYYILKEDMDQVLMDYLGTTVHPDDNYVVYEDGSRDAQIIFNGFRYEFALADGVMYNSLAIASSMTDNGDGTYHVIFDIYEAPWGVEKSDYELTAREASEASHLHRTGEGYATVRDHLRSTGKQSYILLDYTIE